MRELKIIYLAQNKAVIEEMRNKNTLKIISDVNYTFSILMLNLNE